MLQLGLVGKDGEPLSLQRQSRRGHVWHLVYRAPVGVTAGKVDQQRVAVEEALDCSIAVHAEGGRLHIRVGRARIPEHHRLQDAPVPGAGGLVVHLGVGREGALRADLTRPPHTLIGGTSGGGKTALVQSIVLQLAQRYGPGELQLVLGDLKGAVDMSVFDALPHLRWPVIGRHDEAAAALTELVGEQERRQDQLRGARCPNVGEWNVRHPMARLAYIVCVIDEFADLLPKEAPTKEERAEREAAWAAVSSLTRMGRASGIHVIVATQRPDADVLPGQIRANCGRVIAFRCSNEYNSGILLGPGNAAAMRLADRSGLAIHRTDREIQFQAAYIAAAEIEREVQALRTRWRPLPGLRPAPKPAISLPHGSMEEVS
jgi:DNA translocase FtsK/SpoIIIE-like protein